MITYPATKSKVFFDDKSIITELNRILHTAYTLRQCDASARRAIIRIRFFTAFGMT